MALFVDAWRWYCHFCGLESGPALRLLGIASIWLVVGAAWGAYLLLYLIAPVPRPPLPIEQKYRTVEADGNVSGYEKLPCWQHEFDERRRARQWSRKQRAAKNLAYDAKHRVVAGASSPFQVQSESTSPNAPELRPDLGPESAPTGLPTLGEGDIAIEPASVYMSLVVPAYNEDERLGVMLKEAVEVLESTYSIPVSRGAQDNSLHNRKPASKTPSDVNGYEILVVSDGSTDHTVATALDCAKAHGSQIAPKIRVIQLNHNRGKGGAVTHGMRHVRGRYAIFADADGASKFEDLAKLVRACQKIEDSRGRGVAVGSRAHLVGSEAVVRRSFLRNFLMHSFHLLLRFLTPPATAAIGDTQCGFKLFSRAALPFIIPFMHSEGWIFDVEMLMLAESARIPVVEVPIGWREVKGSKLNVVWDSLGMAYGLTVLRLAWSLGIYSAEV